MKTPISGTFLSFSNFWTHFSGFTDYDNDDDDCGLPSRTKGAQNFLAYMENLSWGFHPAKGCKESFFKETLYKYV
jgi:hypothetical protein